MLPRCLPLIFPSIQLTVREQITIKTYKIAGDVARKFSRRMTIVAILNLYVASMPPIKFWLHQTNGLGGDVVWRISRWPPWRPSWISERYNFSNSESLCCSNASHQVLAQSHLRFGQRSRFISRWPPWQPSWIWEQNEFSNSESL